MTIIGHTECLEQLRRAYCAQALHHAYLFTGPRGVGKSTVARWFALLVNCESAESPCGRCRSCKTIASGNHPDVFWLRPEKTGGSVSVAMVREIVRKVGYHRYNSRRRVVVIDPMEALKAPAANALLKTLEEPPHGTGFVLLSTQPQALLPTIRSRCQHLRFSPVSESLIAQWLEDRGVQSAAEVARLAEGCPGRALTLADSGLAAREEAIEELLSYVAGSYAQLFKWSDALSKRKAKREPEVLSQLIDRLEELLRDVAVVGAGASVSLLYPRRQTMSEAWAEVLWPDGLSRLSGAIAEARSQMLLNVNARLVVEALFSALFDELGPRLRRHRYEVGQG